MGPEIEQQRREGAKRLYGNKNTLLNTAEHYEGIKPTKFQVIKDFAVGHQVSRGESWKGSSVSV